MRRAAGFTFVEVAIVLVILGLLLGGVLKGQELVNGARVRQLIAQQEGVKAAFYGFQDRFRALPGDFSEAGALLRCATGVPCLGGNGDGVIDSSAVPRMLTSGVLSEVHEELLVWSHLTSAGFLNGNYAMLGGEATATDANSPKNAYNVHIELAHDGRFAAATATSPAKHNVKTGALIPVEVVAEVDRKIDDGNGVRGQFRYSTYQGNAVSPPSAPAAVYGPGQCVSTDGTWYVTNGELNCGGASLL